MKKIIFLTIFFLTLFGFAYAQQFPWTEGFESADFPPPGWSILHTSGTKTWERYTLNTHNNTSGSAMHDFASGMQTSALITPPITLPNFGTPTLDFWSYTQLIGYQYSGVLVSTTVNDDLTAFTEIKVLAGDEVAIGSWKNISVALDAFNGQTIYIAFLYSGDYGHRWLIDDITVSHFDSYVDIQALSLTPISGEYAILSTNEQVTVKLKNNSGTPASGFPLKLLQNNNVITTENFTGSIPSLGEVTYTFNTTLDLTAQGIHKIQVVANMPDDQVAANDTATSIVTNLGCDVITTFPYFESFENNGNNLPPCWTQEYVAENFKWKVCDAAYAQGIPGLEPLDAFDGAYKAYFYTIGKDDAITKLITPPMDITQMANPVLKFHHIQQQYAGDQDSLKIYYRTSSKSEWVFLEKYTEMIDEWTEQIIPLPEPSNQYFIAFEGYEEYGHSIQIDAITIDDYFGTDIAVKAISPEGVHLGLSEQQEIKATIKNNGRLPVTGFELTLHLNDSFITKEVFTNTIPDLGEVVYSFNKKVDLSVSGTYKLTVVAELESDEVPENDELTVTVKNLVCDALTFPYEEDFEEEIFPPYCWNKIGEWKRTPYGAHSGVGRASYAWWDGSLGWLISPKFSIPADGDFMLEFWSYVYDKKFFTYSGVWISTTTPDVSSFTEIHSLGGNETPDEEWARIEVPLNNYAGKDIYIAFKYTNSGGQSGHMWSVDDIRVFNLSNYVDAEVVAITAPPEINMNLSNNETVTAKIKNNGGESISGFQLILEYNGAVVATENYVGYITSLASVNYTFNKKLDLSAAGNHTLKVTVVLAGDMDPSNDSKSKLIENRVCPATTTYPWHGDFQGDIAGEIDDCWFNIDADGDTKKWQSFEATGQYYALSESYDAAYEFPLTPDNWLISPPLKLDGTYTLSYKVGSANSNEWGAEKYSVLISTKGIDPETFTAVRTETLYPSDYTEFLGGELSGYGLKTVKVPLSSYANETIHLAFRHWDCTEQDMLILTDINVVKELSINENNKNENNPLVAWINNDRLYISGLNIGENLDLYSVMGQLVYQGVVHSDMMSINLNVRGVFIIKSGNRVVKVVY
ncbi:MAG: choice-of-anchor J domain-containing protein [Lentimicrobiaceae bacterium]|nr:choice-of-anchor J domain-containing protein [Lentimicrobiaceae bacterium]